MHRFDYYSPDTLAEAVDLLSTKGEGGKVLAGGTDLVPQMKERGRHPKFLVSLKNIREIQDIELTAAGGLKVGAGVRFGVLQRNPDVNANYDVLAQCSKLIGSIQTQNLATVGGNVCNAAPSADGVPALMILDAEAEIQGPRGARTLPLQELFAGPGKTTLQVDELVTRFSMSPPLERSAGVYLRHVPRKELDIAIAGGGVYIQLDEELEHFTHARICLSSVAPVPMYAAQAANALLGQTPSADLFEHVGELAAREAQPISDHRGSAAFRRALVNALTVKTLTRAVDLVRQGVNGR